MACILGPLSILLGIPALSQRWRGYVEDNVVIETLPDPGLNIILASISLACEVSANVILMLRFSSIAVPLTTTLSLALWIAKVGVCLGNYVQFIIVHPQPHDLETNWIYLEGFWIGCASMVISTIVIVFLILNLTITPPRKNLGIHEAAILEQHRLAHRGFMIRVLILVLAMGFGSLAFSKLEDFSFVTGLYLVTASILTVGFGDVVLETTAAKIILFPYLVFSITYVALMVTSIAGLIDERLDAQKQLREHLTHMTKVTSDQQSKVVQQALGDSRLLVLPITEAGDRQLRASSPTSSESGQKPDIYTTVVKDPEKVYTIPMARAMTLQQEIEVQAGAMARREHHRQIRNIFLALLFFSIFWFIGAIVFAFSEGWAYGEAMYFCYVFFMTVGYGDYSPKSQLGRCLFIVYAMIAVPTVTFLVQVFVEAADVKKYVYNSKRSRQRRIDELDTRELTEIKQHMTQDNQNPQINGLRRSRSVSMVNGSSFTKARTLSRSATMENDRSVTLTKTILLGAPSSPRCPKSRSHSMAISDSPYLEVPSHGPDSFGKFHGKEDTISIGADGEEQDDENYSDDDDEDFSDADIAAEVLASEIQTRSRLVQNARKMDHLTRLLISPHLHHEARLLLSLEMGRLDTHYKNLLRNLSASTNNGRDAEEQNYMEDTKEAEWLGLTGLDRERKFVLEYRECFASLLNDVEALVSDVTPIVSAAPNPPPPVSAGSSIGQVGRREQYRKSTGLSDLQGTDGHTIQPERPSTMEKREGGIKWAH